MWKNRFTMGMTVLGILSSLPVGWTATLESGGAFISAGGVSTVGVVQVFDAVDTRIVSAQRSAKYLARNGWLSSRILIAVPANQADLPLIVGQPRDVTARPGATVRFRVEAVSAAELTYQWRSNGQPIAGATSPIFTITNAAATDEAQYDVVVRTTKGATMSRSARLAIVSRMLRVASVQTTNLNATVTVPVYLIGDGTEHSVAYSISFDAANLALNGIMNRSGADMTLNSPTDGSVGLNFALGTNQVFAAGTNHLCDLMVQAVGITNQAVFGLALGDSPVVRRILDLAENELPAVPVSGTIVFKQPVPAAVNTGSGTLGENLMLSTPDDGSGGPVFVRVLVHDLGVDSLGNPIRLLNAAGTNENGVPFVIFPGTTQPGQTLELDLEYYVSDRITVPSPRFEVETVPDTFFELPPGVEVMPLTRGLAVDGKFYLDFPTDADRTYYIQFLDGSIAGAWQTSLPAIVGSGVNRQWIDNGPPRTTVKPPNTGARFYRVVRVP